VRVQLVDDIRAEVGEDVGVVECQLIYTKYTMKMVRKNNDARVTANPEILL